MVPAAAPITVWRADVEKHILVLLLVLRGSCQLFTIGCVSHGFSLRWGSLLFRFVERFRPPSVEFRCFFGIAWDDHVLLFPFILSVEGRQPGLSSLFIFLFFVDSFSLLFLSVQIPISYWFSFGSFHVFRNLFISSKSSSMVECLFVVFAYISAYFCQLSSNASPLTSFSNLILVIWIFFLFMVNLAILSFVDLFKK